MDHQQVEELLGAYIVGATTDAERRDFEAHVATCVQCAARVDEFRRVANLLPLAADIESPPARLKVKILAGTRSGQLAVPAYKPEPLFKRIFMKPQPAFALAAASLVLAVGLAVWNQDLQSKNKDKDAEIARLQQSMVIADIKGTDAAPTASARILFLKDQKVALLQTQGLPALPANQTYQMWLIADGAPVSAGLFQVNPATQTASALIVGDPAAFKKVAVSVEAAGGVPSPKGSIVLLGDL